MICLELSLIPLNSSDSRGGLRSVHGNAIAFLLISLGKTPGFAGGP